MMNHGLFDLRGQFDSFLPIRKEQIQFEFHKEPNFSFNFNQKLAGDMPDFFGGIELEPQSPIFPNDIECLEAQDFPDVQAPGSPIFKGLCSISSSTTVNEAVIKEPLKTQRVGRSRPSSAENRAKKQSTIHPKRFLSNQRSALDSWFKSHSSHPFPSKSDIDALESSTGLSKRQIQVFFTNKRARTK